MKTTTQKFLHRFFNKQRKNSLRESIVKML